MCGEETTSTRCKRLHTMATTRSSSGCSRGSTPTRREEATATRWRWLWTVATTISSSGCSRKGPTSTRGEEGAYTDGPRVQMTLVCAYPACAQLPAYEKGPHMCISRICRLSAYTNGSHVQKALVCEWPLYAQARYVRAPVSYTHLTLPTKA